MARGGYRKPSGPRPASGPGKYSQRTDANEVPDTPNVGDSDELQYGDRKRLEAAQSVAPRARRERPDGPAPGRAAPAPVSGGTIPPHLLEMESTRPLEPPTAGLDVGPGDGSEVLAMQQAPETPAEIVLTKLVEWFADRNATEMLAELRAQKQRQTGPPLV